MARSDLVLSDASTTIAAFNLNTLFSVKSIVAVVTGGGTVQKHGKIRPIQADVSSPSSLAIAASTIASESGHVNLVVANAGIQGPTLGALPQDASVQDFQSFLANRNVSTINDTFAVNTTAVLSTLVAFLDLLDKGNKAGNVEQSSQIIAVSSAGAYSRVPMAGFAYAASKAATIHMMKQLATRMVPFDIRSNVIAPGLFPSEMAADIIKKANHGKFPRDFIPEKRAGDVKDIAGAILFLAGRSGGYVNGNVLLTEGGGSVYYPQHTEFRDTRSTEASHCKSLRIQSQDFNGIHEVRTSTPAGDYVDLGSIDETIARSTYCALCRLAVHSLDLHHPRWSPRLPNLTVRLLWTGDYEESREGISIHHRAQLYLKPSIHSEMAMMQHNVARCRLLLSGGDKGASTARPEFLTGQPPMDSKKCFAVMQTWIAKCITTHEECNASEQDLGMDISSIMVIDVVQGRLIDIGATQRYFALSYVWGQGATFETLRSNVVQLCQPGGVDDVRKLLPKTIIDAMDLVAAIGENFLWCDRLCIVQDDPVTKHALINRMDQIYGAAFAVIMARSGANADEGMFGCNPLHIKEQIADDVELIASPEYRQNSVSNVSALESRAWTFQEQLLAQRCLVFDNGLACFECKSAIWRQDVNLEYPPHDSRIDDLKRDWGFQFNHILTSKISALHTTYQNCIQAYSTRNLSFHADALNAFAGIGKILATKLESPLYYGIPVQLFDWAILWLVPFNSVRCNQLPTWSWVAWPGMKNIHYESVHGKATSTTPNPNTWIEWYFDDVECGVIRPLETLAHRESHYCRDHEGVIAPRMVSNKFEVSASIDQLSRRIVAPPLTFKTGCDGSLGSLVDPVSHPATPLQHGALRFYTICASFTVFGAAIKDPHRPSSHLRHGIQDRHGITCGELDNRHDLYEDFPPELVGTQHVIILSEKDDRWSETRYLAMLNERGIERHSCVSRHKDFNVLLVDWNDGYATRKGIGYIRQIALDFALEAPEWRLVVLV